MDNLPEDLHGLKISGFTFPPCSRPRLSDRFSSSILEKRKDNINTAFIGTMSMKTKMFGRVATLAFCLGYASAQTSTTELFIAGFDDSNSLSGAVIGTGSAGTTFILEGVDVLSTTTIPFTSCVISSPLLAGFVTYAYDFFSMRTIVTVVEGSIAMIETAIVPADSDFGAFAACSFEPAPSGAAGGLAVCAEIVQNAGTTNTLLNTFPLSSIAIPVSTDTPPPGFGPITLPSAATGSGSTASAKSTITSVSQTNTSPQSTIGPSSTTSTTSGASAIDVQALGVWGASTLIQLSLFELCDADPSAHANPTLTSLTNQIHSMNTSMTTRRAPVRVYSLKKIDAKFSLSGWQAATVTGCGDGGRRERDDGGMKANPAWLYTFSKRSIEAPPLLEGWQHTWADQPTGYLVQRIKSDGHDRRVASESSRVFVVSGLHVSLPQPP
ncbi:hypothetical protein SCHPADRAFT_892758 [Schizopora paradoxa]|uniref:Uncharacterized protein n=1 Tax=Schizopora paradoxa TaxID=27342 RepID=A0A0H2RE90_9AGAM|nr:hypothetical protein SCHPADRAFT_892758 [Schizopora paradoxa]